MDDFAVCKIAFIIAIIVGFFPIICFSNNECDEIVYKELLTQYEESRDILGVDNLKARLVWQRSFYLEGLLEAYLCTKKNVYIKRFLLHVEDIQSLRDDIIKRLDYTGKSNPGYSVSNHYPISKPYLILDEKGKPVIKLTAVRFAGNNATSFEVISSKDGKSYSLLITNSHGGKETTEEYYELNSFNAEEKVNKFRGKEQLVKLEIVSDGIPRNTHASFKDLIPNIILHSHHDGSIYAPMIRLLALSKVGMIDKSFLMYKKKWISFVEQALAANEQNWVEQGNYGYYRLPKGMPFWCDGAPEAINAMSEVGRLYLYLWIVTAENKYLERVNKIINLIYANMSKDKQGYLTWTYWHSDAIKGWSAGDDISQNSPEFAPYPWKDNTHYAQYTVRFLTEAFNYNIKAVTKKNIAELVLVFDAVWKGNTIYSRATSKYLSVNLDGHLNSSFGRDDIDVYGFAFLGCIDETVTNRLYDMYTQKYSGFSLIKRSPSVALYSWALLNRIRGVGCGNN